jgi:hypothetical protein
VTCAAKVGIEPILLKNSTTAKSHSKTGTWFSERAPWQTLFLNTRSRGKVFCEIDRLWADTDFFNEISPIQPFSAMQ